ncbi:uncharacterized protein LOC111443683 [Cucurbita moschata]|uniref:Uncharacterized protein LOC111443683 n=1 Tax=Cucurbita moschata TaxID=3662 RepID=A0A6J1FB06_CUCMO|nr:uncharacterized protein LOC111443683 [Cucurbita moschata]
MQLWLRIPLVKVDDDSTNVKSDHLVDSWDLWNTFRLALRAPRSTLPSPNARLDDGLRSLSKRPYLVPPCNYIGHFLKIKQISEVDYWILIRHFLDCRRSGT